MTQAIPFRNPVLWSKIEPGLTTGERKFVDCMTRGVACVLAKNTPEEGNDENTVRGNVIRFFAFGGDEAHPVLGTTIHLEGAWIPDALDLCNARISYVLGLCSCHFAGNVMMLQMECPTLSMGNSFLRGCLFGDGLVTTGSVRLNGMDGRFTAMDGVRLLNARIGGSLTCTNAFFGNIEGIALAADHMTVGNTVYLGYRYGAENEKSEAGPKFPPPFYADGEVRMLGARIGGNLDCAGGVFLNKEGCAIKADGVEVEGTFFMSDYFVANGSVIITGARIAELTCENATLAGNSKNSWALIAERAEIRGGVNWRRVTGSGEVNFSSTKAGTLSDDEESWGKFKVILDGFQYSRIIGDGTPTNFKSRIEWLKNRPKRLPFSPLPYEQAAKVLFDMGHDNDAREILLKKEQEITKRKTRWHKPHRWLWEKLAGYGYKPVRTLIASLIVILIGWSIFWLADCAGRIVPHQPTVLANVKYQYGRIPSETPAETVARKLPGYPEFSPFWFSLDIFVPLFNLHQEPFWYPSPDGGRPYWWSTPQSEEFSLWFMLEWWYWIQIGFGWILTSLFLLSVTGLLRPRESSGGTD